MALVRKTLSTLTLAVTALATFPALAQFGGVDQVDSGTGAVPPSELSELASPGMLGLIAAGIVISIALARRRK